LAPSSLVGLAYGFTPIAIIIVGAILRTSYPRSIQILGSILSSIGVLTLFLYRGLSIRGLQDLAGLALGLITSFIWAVYIVIQKKLYPEGDQTALTYASLLMAVAILGPSSAPYIYLEFPRISRPEILAQLLWIAILPGALAYYMWNKAASLVGSASAAPFSNFLPVFTAILGHVILGEELGIGDILGGGLIIAGSAISVYGGSRYIRSDAKEKEV
jgi:drug/metabolite transporter (DMT)-like permease